MSESEETEGQKPHVKLRRAVSENPRPASTPPTLTSGDKEDGEEEKTAAELEVNQTMGCVLLYVDYILNRLLFNDLENCSFYYLY